MFRNVLLGASLALLPASAIAAPLTLHYDVTDLGGTYQYDFTMVAEDLFGFLADGTFVPGAEWDWFVIGVYETGDTPIFPEGPSFFTSVPAGWKTSLTQGGTWGPTLSVGESALLPGWQPAFVGDSFSFTGVSSALVAPGDLIWSSLISYGGNFLTIPRAIAVTDAPVPLPPGLGLLSGGLVLLGAGRRVHASRAS